MGELKICITGAAGQISYSLLYMICRGDMFGLEQKLHLTLLEITPMQEALRGVALELEDCAFPLLSKITHTDDCNVAFDGIDVAVLVGAMPRREGMERKDLLKANAKIFEVQGKALEQHAKKDVKVLVVGNPANTNAYICSQMASTIPKKNYSCLTRLDMNRAKAQLSLKSGLSVADVTNVIIWGNHSNTQFPDASVAKIKGTLASSVIKDDAWMQGEFVTTVQQRGARVIQIRKLSSAMSAAKAICDHMRDWFNGTDPDTFVSMGVISDGSYGITPGVVYSFPVTIKDGEWSIVQGLEVSPFARTKLDATLKELEEEREIVSRLLASM